MNNTGSAYLNELLIGKKALRTLQSSDLSLLEVPRARTVTLGKRAFEYAALFTRNSLPLHISQSKTITIFMKVAKTYLLSSI